MLPIIKTQASTYMRNSDGVCDREKKCVMCEKYSSVSVAITYVEELDEDNDSKCG